MSEAPLRPILRLLVLVGALAYATFIYLHGSPFAAGSDSSGYLNSARLLARGELTAPIRSLPALGPGVWDLAWQQPLGFTMQPGVQRLRPAYPTGVPLHLLAVAPVLGWEKAARAVNVLNVLIAGALLFSLARQLSLGRGWALTAVALLWSCPLFIYNALQPLSDSLALTWGVAAIWFALKSRTHASWGLAAGVAFAGAILVRPNSLLLAVPLALTLGRSPRAWFAFGLGGLPGAAWFAYYNVQLFGHAVITGYGNLSPAFGRRWAIGNLAHFAVWVPLLSSIPVAIAAAFLPWFAPKSAPRFTPAILGTWFGAFVLFYTPYFCAGENWGYLRFLLPAFPAVIIAGLLVAQNFRSVPPWCALVPVLAVQLFIGRELQITAIRDEERRYVLATRWLDARAPKGAVVFTGQLSGAIHYYSERQIIIRPELMPPDRLALVQQAAREARLEIYAALFPFEIGPFFERFSAAHWELVGELPAVTFYRLATDAG
jgi:hypothetical protein